MMVVGGGQQETLDPGFVLLGTRQQGVPVILRELVLPGGFDLVLPSFTVRSPPSDQSFVTVNALCKNCSVPVGPELRDLMAALSTARQMQMVS
ncbi:unnamed protein product [Schistosoma margrebowiei]|uniref:Uncharacterized protein n=1 Tax=Schistosoma margrebowiei TaxID=48269 RepID=A0A183LZ72_9TREM|nr:unnamed protein product [Schistosoma margrebowiei]